MARVETLFRSLHVSRRTFASGVTACALAGGTATSARAETTRMLRFGDTEVIVISDGFMTMPTSFALPKTSAADVSALFDKHRADTRAIQAPVNVVVVRKPDALVVIDSGGTSDFMPSLGGFSDRLDQAGIKAADVTHVVFTHAHADHLWGVIDPLDDDTRFPNARHFMTVAERDYWLKPGIENDVPDAVRGMAIGTQRRLQMLSKRIETVAPGSEIMPGISALDTSGHTPGHISIRLQLGNEALIVGGDAIGHAIVSFEKPSWPWGADVDADKGVATRLRLLDLLANEKASLLGYHLPWPGFGRVERSGNAYRFVAD